MDLDDLLKAKKPAGAMFGEVLTALSIPDLEARMTLIEAERQRTEGEIAARKAARNAAEGFFKS